jgi:hypothetical protein
MGLPCSKPKNVLASFLSAGRLPILSSQHTPRDLVDWRLEAKHKAKHKHSNTSEHRLTRITVLPWYVLLPADGCRDRGAESNVWEKIHSITDWARKRKPRDSASLKTQSRGAGIDMGRTLNIISEELASPANHRAGIVCVNWSLLWTAWLRNSGFHNVRIIIHKESSFNTRYVSVGVV